MLLAISLGLVFVRDAVDEVIQFFGHIVSPFCGTFAPVSAVRK